MTINNPATVTVSAERLRRVMTGLGLFTTDERPNLNVAQAKTTELDGVTALQWTATDACTLVTITATVEHTVAPDTRIIVDPAAILAVLPKKTDDKYGGPVTLTVDGDEWALKNNNFSAAGKTSQDGVFPNVEPLFDNQGDSITPYQIDPDYLARLAKLAKTLGKTSRVRHVSQGQRDGKPSADKPVLFDVIADDMTARVLIMPQRFGK